MPLEPPYPEASSSLPLTWKLTASKEPNSGGNLPERLSPTTPT